jgi:hypothetical protein
MKRTYTLLLGTSLAIATSMAFAQTSPPPTETQMRDQTDTQNRMATDGSDVTKRQKSYFKALDRQSRGYVTVDDVSADPFLSQNFPKCDVDHDGKLTWEEYKTCTHNNPPPKSP